MVMFFIGISLFNNRIYTNTTQLIFRKFDGKVAHWPRKNMLDFGGNPDHVVLRRVRVMARWVTAIVHAFVILHAS